MKFVLSVLHRTTDAGKSVRKVGEFVRLEDAVAAARQEVDAMLNREYVTGMTAAQLLAAYQAAGETPFIFRDDEETMNAGSFNHFKYAKTRCDEMCAGKG